MKSYVSANAQYYKNSNAAGAFGHILRTFLENKNVYPELTKNNFSSPDIMKKYQELYSSHQSNLKKKMTGKENTFLDIVVAFSLDNFEELEKTLTKEELQERLSSSMNDFLNTLKMNYGFEPVGFAFHLDEGHTCPETGKLKRNIHAHAIIYNYDFKNKVAPLRKMKKEHFSEWQDLAGFAFGNLGFERGISKEQTKKNHLEKDDFVAEKHKEIERLKTTIKKGKLAELKLRESVKTEKKKLSFLAEKVREIAGAMPHLFGAIFALDTPEVLRWSKVIAAAIPSKSIKSEVVKSLDNLADYSNEYATEMCEMIDTSKEEIEFQYQEIQKQKKKKSPGLTR